MVFSKASLAIALALAASQVDGAIVLSDRVSITSISPTEFRATVLQTPANLNTPASDVTNIWFKYTPVSVGNPVAKLEAVTWWLDDGSDWSLVQLNDRFHSRDLALKRFPIFVSDSIPGYYPGPPVPVNLASNGFIYLGINTGVSYDDGPPPNPGSSSRDAYGWLKLGRTSSGQWFAAESAIAYNSLGIIVGTTTSIPEPSTSGLLLMGILSGSARLRRCLSYCSGLNTI